MKKPDAVIFHSGIARDFDQHYFNSSRSQERKATLEQLIRQHSNSSHKVLDLGCGPGHFTLFMARLNRQVFAVDGSQAMLAICKEKIDSSQTNNITIVESRIDIFCNNTNEVFDLIFCSSVLEYVEDLDSSLASIKKILKPGGYFIYSIPNRQSLFRKIEPVCYRLLGWPEYFAFVRNVPTSKEMSYQIQKSGFKVETFDFFGETPILSFFFRKLGLRRFSDNMMVFIVRS